MIVWLASYPRSGNTFLRVVLHRFYGLPTYSVYADDDPVAQRVGPALVGYRPMPTDRNSAIEGGDVYFVKTHKRRKADGFPAICLVRDGRDALVSRARLLASERGEEDNHALFESLLREQITRPLLDGQASSGTWGGNVLSWLNSAGAPLAILRYEDLIVDPRAAVERAVSALVPDLVPRRDAPLPSFADLHEIDPRFFRRGLPRSHRTEMSEELHDLFWAQAENALAMRHLGYDRDGRAPSPGAAAEQGVS